MKTVIARLREPSTWSAIGVVGVLVGVKIAPETWGNIATAGSALAALAAAALPESGPKS